MHGKLKIIDFLNPDFCKLADSYGAQSRKPASLQELQNDITEAFKAEIPTVIHITEIAK